MTDKPQQWEGVSLKETGELTISKVTAEGNNSETSRPSNKNNKDQASINYYIWRFLPSIKVYPGEQFGTFQLEILASNAYNFLYLTIAK